MMKTLTTAVLVVASAALLPGRAGAQTDSCPGFREIVEAGVPTTVGDRDLMVRLLAAKVGPQLGQTFDPAVAEKALADNLRPSAACRDHSRPCFYHGQRGSLLRASLTAGQLTYLNPQRRFLAERGVNNDVSEEVARRTALDGLAAFGVPAAEIGPPMVRALMAATQDTPLKTPTQVLRAEVHVNVSPRRGRSRVASRTMAPSTARGGIARLYVRARSLIPGLRVEATAPADGRPGRPGEDGRRQPMRSVAKVFARTPTSRRRLERSENNEPATRRSAASARVGGRSATSPLGETSLGEQGPSSRSWEPAAVTEEVAMLRTDAGRGPAPSYALDDPGAETAGRLDAFLAGVDCRDKRIAIGAGSRGIDRIAAVVRAVAATLKGRGARPFIIPAMGSHGGGTAEGQLELLDSFGINEATMGVPLRPSMDVVEIGTTEAGEPVFTAREALEADGVVLVNRVKPHTDFESTRVGSGLVKMAAIGLGKVEGAAAAHRAARRHGYEASIAAASRLVRSRVKLLAGVALLEDPHHHLAMVEVVPVAEIEGREPALLAHARAWMPALPFPEVDILILDEIGKNISGGGGHQRVVGRGVGRMPFSPRLRAATSTSAPHPESHGNAVGVGLAVSPLRLSSPRGPRAMYTNAVGHDGHGARADALRHRRRVPLRPSSVSGTDPRRAHRPRRNTLAVDRFVVSGAYMDGGRARHPTVLVPPRPVDARCGAT
jgi:hypothetical protein